VTGWRTRGLMALIAVLLPAGVGAAATVDTGPAPVNGPVGAASIGQEAITETTVATAPVVVTTTTPAPPPVVTLPVTTTPARTTAPPTTKPAPAPAPAPVITLPAGITLPPLLPTLPVLELAPAGTWSNASNGMTVRMKMDPVTPLAGQPVRFTIDVTAQSPCCVVMLSYGDGTARPGFGGGCDSPHTQTGLVATHTFAAAGDYEVALIVSTWPCYASPPPPGAPPAAPPIDGTGVTACIGVGIRLPVRPSCTPTELFRPGTVYTYA
jgi:hypothetical protein